ncbi:MAG TPA: glycosyltransferase [Candidatus Nanoarchaeia archaeon]|nr:glycosyltransferase [Candidatus Nanoarchaeia archaeon]
MKKLLIATDTYHPWQDGVTRTLAEIIPRLRKHFEIHILCPDFGPHDEKGVVIHKVPLSNLQIKEVTGGFRFAQFKPSLVKQVVSQCDLIFSQDLGPIGLLAIHYARKLKKPVASYIHTLEWERIPAVISAPVLKFLTRKFMRWITKKYYNKCDLLIVPSDTIGERLAWQGIHPRKEIIPLGVDVHTFKPGQNKELRQQLGIEEKDIVIGYHGRIAREKDLPTLLRAYVHLRRKYPTLKLLIVGEGLKLLTWRLEHQTGVILPGKQEQVVPYLQCMDIYCLTSLSETTSLSTLEAMSCGLPVIATPVGFIREYLHNRQNGLITPKRDSVILANKIENLIQSPELRKTLGENARKTIEQQFNWESTAEKIRKVLEIL